jgi:hypothetical protein
MPSPESPTWIPTVPKPGDAYMAEARLFNFEIRATIDRGYRLRGWEIRPEGSSLRF